MLDESDSFAKSLKTVNKKESYLLDDTVLDSQQILQYMYFHLLPKILLNYLDIWFGLIPMEHRNNFINKVFSYS